MNPNDYQKAALRTESDPGSAYKRLGGQLDDGWLDRQGISNGRNVRLFHGMTGLVTEVGELATLLKKHVFYGQGLDPLKIKDELGDILWYVALTCDAAGLNLSDVMAANIAKLKVRFPDKFTEERATDEARDRVAEAAVQGSQPFNFKGD